MAAIFGGCARACAGLARGCAKCGQVTCKGCFKCGKVTCKGCAKCCRATFKQCRKCCKQTAKRAKKAGKKGRKGRSKSKSKRNNEYEDDGDWEAFFDDSDLDDEDIGEDAEQGELPPLLLTMNREGGAAPDPNVCVTCGARVEPQPS